MPAETVLETRGLRKAFGGVVALDRVDFRVGRSEIRALIGPNGAGKTTLINVITGLFPPTEGEVWLGGREISRLPPERIARLGMARTFQLTAIFPGCSVLDNVRVACSAARRFGRQPASVALLAEAREILALTGLEALESSPASTLSHGDQKVLELAIGLALRPAILLLDEPTAGMSLAETRRSIEILKSLRGLTSVVVVEHDMNVVMQTADIVTVLSNGRIIAEGPPAAIRSNEEVREVYLGH